ncbi:MBL fold metallo-hydrolase [Microvirga aerilata]
MKITQVRNATLIIEYAGKKILVDPMLAEKGAYPGFEGTANSDKRNPWPT